MRSVQENGPSRPLLDNSILRTRKMARPISAAANRSPAPWSTCPAGDTPSVSTNAAQTHLDNYGGWAIPST